ncbi:CHAT domain-containing protein [Brevundimonas sp.]|uniref:CHAT domain-containing protein n=1 Tax=Brevundimonas sp. TaxID=1871086 RepID=UPI0025FCAF14|nr:CHAT domain-containing protein [Brevundimonas sp.]
MRAWGVLSLILALALAPLAEARRSPNDAAHLRDEAFEAAQWAMTSEAAEALARMSARFAQGDDAIAALAEEREALIARRDRLERQTEQVNQLEGPDRDQRRAEAATDYGRVLARLREIDAEIDTRFPAYGELTSPRALDVARTQALLNEDEGLLLVLVNRDAAYVWAVTREQVAWARAADLGEAEVTRVVARLRESLTAEASRGQPYIDPSQIQAGRGFDLFEAHRLYDRLIRPVEPALAGKTTLITVTTGALSTLPLSVLITEPPTAPDTSAAALAASPWLIDRYALASLPAVSSLEALRCHLAAPGRRHPGCGGGADGSARTATREPGPTLAAFGAPTLAGRVEPATRGSPGTDTVFTEEGGLADVERLRRLPALPGSRDELGALSARFPDALIRMGDAATERAVRFEDREALSRARYVVFSTHGLLAGEAAGLGEPGLVLTPPQEAGPTDDGYLAASEAAQLELSADFVVLSACNTAASDGRPGGQGLSGLARAFFYAGARSMLVSHWAVSDRATSRLITETFEAMDDGDFGGHARALQHAMREVRSNRAWAHPAYWAAFTLVGEAA